MTQQEYMNITAAARKLGVSRQRVYALIKQKRLSLLDKKGLGKVISSIEIPQNKLYCVIENNNTGKT